MLAPPWRARPAPPRPTALPTARRRRPQVAAPQAGAAVLEQLLIWRGDTLTEVGASRASLAPSLVLRKRVRRPPAATAVNPAPLRRFPLRCPWT